MNNAQIPTILQSVLFVISIIGPAAVSPRKGLKLFSSHLRHFEHNFFDDLMKMGWNFMMLLKKRTINAQKLTLRKLEPSLRQSKLKLDCFDTIVVTNKWAFLIDLRLLVTSSVVVFYCWMQGAETLTFLHRKLSSYLKITKIVSILC